MKKKFYLMSPLRGYPKGYKISLDTNKEGKPLDRYWAARYEDAKTDKCMSTYAEPEIVKTNKKLKDKHFSE